MLEAIFILSMLIFLMTAFLIIRDVHRMLESRKVISTAPSIMATLEGSPFHNDWEGKLPPSQPQDEPLTEASPAIIPGHIIEALDTDNPLRQTPEEREYLAEAEANRRYQQERTNL